MNDSEAKTSTALEADDVKQQCACLQRQMTTLLLAVVIVSGTLSVFLWRQVRYARRDLEAMKAPASQIIQEFNQAKSGMDAFLNKIVEYGRTNADFAPIMTKYQLALYPAPAAAIAKPPVAAKPPVVAKPIAAPATAPKK